MQKVGDAVKAFCEEMLKLESQDFQIPAMVTWVQSAFPAATHDEVVAALNEHISSGEVALEAVDPTQQIYRVKPPAAAQTTAFGAPSGGTAPNGEAKKKKKSPFTKKQKTAALEELAAVGELTPGLERLHDWLFEQVYG